jgi:hypothetical protein
VPTYLGTYRTSQYLGQLPASEALALTAGARTQADAPAHLQGRACNFCRGTFELLPSLSSWGGGGVGYLKSTLIPLTRAHSDQVSLINPVDPVAPPSNTREISRCFTTIPHHAIMCHGNQEGLALSCLTRCMNRGMVMAHLLSLCDAELLSLSELR